MPFLPPVIPASKMAKTDGIITTRKDSTSGGRDPAAMAAESKGVMANESRIVRAKNRWRE
jgi:hypothetical protein